MALAPLVIDEEGRPKPRRVQVAEYFNAQEGSRFAMSSFYFYAPRWTYKVVLRFDKGTVTLSRRQGRTGSATWVELKQWSVAV